MRANTLSLSPGRNVAVCLAVVGIFGCNGGGDELATSHQALQAGYVAVDASTAQPGSLATVAADLSAAVRTDLSAVPTPTTAQEIIEAARARFRTKADPANGVTSVPLLELGSDDEAPSAIDDDVNGFSARFATRSAEEIRRKPNVGATALMPYLSQGAVALADRASPSQLSIKLDANDGVEGSVIDSYVVYPQAEPQGADVIRRPLRKGFQDYFIFEQAPSTPRIRYDVTLGPSIVGLRLIGNVLEFIDGAGAPRLRLSPPYVIDRDGRHQDASITVEGCSVDTDPLPPQGRSVQSPGAGTCAVFVSWDSAGIAYPAMLDPDWNSTTYNMAVGRYAFSMAALPNTGTKGKVLVAGGYTTNFTNSPTATAELFNAADGTWTTTGSIIANLGSGNVTYAIGQTGTATLSDGRVMIAGGSTTWGSNTGTKAVSIYDPTTGIWAPGVNLNTARYWPSLTTLDTGEVLAAGGTQTNSAAELFNASATSVSNKATLPANLAGHVAVLAPIGGARRVLVAGGSSTIKNTYYYDAGSNSWVLSGTLSIARQKGPAAAVLDDGRVVIAGGGSRQLEVYSGGSWTSPAPWTLGAGSTNDNYYHISATKMANGDICFVGGSNLDYADTSSRYADRLPAPGYVQTFNTDPPFVDRTLHGAALLNDGRVLVAGGRQEHAGGVASSELFLSPQGGDCSWDSDCASGSCTSGICSGGSCSSDADCGVGGYCTSGGLCAPRLSNGAPSSLAAHCSSGILADGLCCDTTCGGSNDSDCQRCDVPGSRGICSGDADLTCNGYKCSASSTACPSSCGGDSDCASGYRCISTQCQALAAQAAPCSVDTDCVSGHCVGFICCDTACDGACDTCSASGSAGTCTGITTGSCASVPSPPTLASASPGSTPDVLDAMNAIIGQTQQGVTATIDRTRASLLRGIVQTKDGMPLAGVQVDIRGDATYGSTITRYDGNWELLVNGGQRLIVRFQAQNFITAERPVVPRQQDFTPVDTVALVPVDTIATSISVGTSSGPTMHISSAPAGRKTYVLFLPATHAYFGAQELTSFTLRASESTVVDNPNVMMGPLPANSAYTFASDLHVESPIPATGFTEEDHIYFYQGATPTSTEMQHFPIVYVSVEETNESFLAEKAGTAIPLGWFDKKTAQWKSLTSGAIIQIMTSAGDVDTNGDYQIDNGCISSNDCITSDEMAQLAANFSVGKKLWRVRMPHFTAVDLNEADNWYILAGAHPPGPNPRPTANDHVDDPDCAKGSIIDCSNFSLGEQIPLAGTPFALHYESLRQPGRYAGRQVTIPFDTVPAGALVKTHMEIAGQSIDWDVDPTGITSVTMPWDGHDAWGRPVNGERVATVRYAFKFPTQYATGAPFGYVALASAYTDLLGPVDTRDWGTLWSPEWSVPLTAYDDLAYEQLGGWTLDVHHGYDPVSRSLRFGDGRIRRASAEGSVVRENRSLSWSSGTGLAVAADGTSYLIDYSSAGVHAVTASSDTVFLNNTEVVFATNPRLGIDDAIYVATGNGISGDSFSGHAIARKARDGVGGVSRVAGGGGSSCVAWTGTPIPATSIALATLNDFDIGPDGSIFISDSCADPIGHRIWQVHPDGTAEVLVGSESRLSGLTSVVPGDYLAAGPDGSVYFTVGSPSSTIKRVGPDGKLYDVFGAGGTSYAEGLLATAVYGPSFGNIGQGGLHIGRDGALFFTGITACVVYRIGSDGIISTYAGVRGGTCGHAGDRAPALSNALAAISGMTVAPDGLLHVADDSSGQTWLNTISATLPRPQTGISSYAVPSNDGSEIYNFDVQGRHLTTVDARTGLTRFAFTYYDSGNPSPCNAVSDGTLCTIDDYRSGVDLSTWIDRSAWPNIIVQGPYGHKTTLHVDPNQKTLLSVEDPLHRAIEMTMTAEGMLTGMTDRRGNVHEFRYDKNGRVIYDGDPEGGTQTLSVLTPTKRRRTSGEGRNYDTDITWAGNTETRTHYSPMNTLQSNVTIDHHDGTGAATYDDGSQSSSTAVSSPRFGMSAPLFSLSSVTSNGTTATTSVSSRTILCGACGSSAPCDAGNFGALVSETTTYSLPGSGNLTSSFTTCNGAPEPYLQSESTSVTYNSVNGTRTSSMTLDTLGRPKTISRSGLYPIVLGYDPSSGKLTTVTQGTRTNTLSYNGGTTGGGSGQLTSLAAPASMTTTWSNFDAFGRAATVDLPGSVSGSRQLGLSWDFDENLSSVIPPGKTAHGFLANGNDALGAYHPPTIGSSPGYNTQYVYDKDRVLKTVVRPDGDNLGFPYHDDAGRLLEASHAWGVVDYAYETGTVGSPAWNRLHTVTASGETLTYSYTGDGPLVSGVNWSGAVGGGLTFGYDNALRLSSETINGANTATMIYDEGGLLKEVDYGSNTFKLEHDPDNGAAQFTGDPTGKRYNGALWKATLSNGTNTIDDARTYNAYGEMKHYQATRSSTTLFSATYDDAATMHRDDLGRILQLDESLYGSGGLDGTTQALSLRYGYDTFGRLAQVYVYDGTSYVLREAYNYDVNGNRLVVQNDRFSAAITTNATLCGGAACTAYDEQDRLVKYGTSTSNQQIFTYRKNGERLTKLVGGVTTSYTYDALGNLLSVVPSTGTRIDYVVDGLGRRVGRKVNGSGTASTQYLWDGPLRIVAMADSSGTLQQRYLYATRTNVPDFVIDSSTGNVYRVITDHLGSVRLVVGLADGVVKERHSYDGFGNELSGTWGPNYVASGWTRVPFGFAGGLYDTTTGLYRFGARDYDPVVGQWLSKDPIRFGGGDSNIYAYVQNNPVNHVDTAGLTVSFEDPALEQYWQWARDTPAGPFLALLDDPSVQVQVVRATAANVASLPGAQNRRAISRILAHDGACTAYLGGRPNVILIDEAQIEKFMLGQGMNPDITAAIAHEAGHNIADLISNDQSLGHFFGNILQSLVSGKPVR